MREAIELKLGGRNDVHEYIGQNFSQLIETLQVDAYNLYLECERELGGKAIRQHIVDELHGRVEVQAALDAAEKSFHEWDRFFLSLTQSRRSRAGTAFQEIMSALMDKMGYPFEAQPVLTDSKPDFVMPSKDWYLHNASDCIILTLKRTLRERWRQVPTEGNSGSTFFLGTIDAKVPPLELDKMKELNVRLVVPARLKQLNYSKHPAVISFEDFFEDHLQPAIKRWIKAGAIISKAN